MAKRIEVPQEVKDYLKKPDIQKLLKTDDLEGVYMRLTSRSHDYYELNSSSKSLIWEIFVNAGINLADGFKQIPAILINSQYVQKLDLDGDRATSIADGFAEGSSVQEVTIGDNILSIGKRAFANCKNLTNVYLGEGVQRIDAEAFTNCPKLNKIYLPESVRILGEDALKAHEDCYIFSPPRKAGTLHVKGNTEWLRKHLGVDPRYREEAEAPVESEE